MTVGNALLAGRYRLERLIGRGGMASVWRAIDTSTGEPVAIKRLHARLHDDPELAERFRREGQAVARLDHPNLVRLLDQGQDGDEPFLVFELVEGRDLKTIIRRDGKRPPVEAASICGQVARALAAAHAAGVVHRDIKSHNVIVTDDGVAKLTDFGIARIVENEGANLTKTGIVMGSSDYLAPEQAEGKSVDHRADIYSLGVVFFEMLTGALPFSGDNAVAVATKHVYEEPPDPRKLDAKVPKPLAAACLRAMAKRPAHRFVSAAAFASAVDARPDDTAALEDGSESETGRLKTVGRRSRRGALVGGGLAAVLAAAAVSWQVGLFGDDGRGSGPARSLQFSVEDYDPLGDEGEGGASVANATDGDPTTSWSTEKYALASLGGIKTGVGLRLSLDPAARVASVKLTSSTPGGRVLILGPDADLTNPAPVGEAALVAGTVDIPVSASGAMNEMVVWITTLPESGEGGDLPFQARIGEVEVTGVANT